jgi:hypothetical protein
MKIVGKSQLHSLMARHTIRAENGMRYAVLTLAVLFGILSVVALTGLGWRLLGWGIAGAFQSVLHYSSDPSAQIEMLIWSGASIISLFFTVRLSLLYRRH